MSGKIFRINAAQTNRMLGSKILLMPPSLTLIFRHKLEMVCGDVLLTFFDWTHCVAIPNIISPTRFTSAKSHHRILQELNICGTAKFAECNSNAGSLKLFSM